MKIEAGATVGALVDIGLAQNIEFNEEYENIYLVPDNGPRVLKGRKNHRAGIKFDMFEFYIDNVYNLRGGSGADTKGTVAGSSTPVVDERHVLTGTTGCRFDHKNGDNTICTSISVKNAAGSSAVLNTDYVLYLDPAGYTCIARVSGSTTIPTGDNTKADELEAYADRVIAGYDELAPGFADSVLHRQVIGPYEMEHEYGLIGGNIFHGELSAEQLFHMRPAPGYADYRSPIRGLYQASSATHGGGGVCGIPGYNAVRQIKADRRGRGARRTR
jgi:hypothetical protein